MADVEVVGECRKGDKIFQIRSYLMTDSIGEYRKLFMSCQNLVEKGLEEFDQRLVNIGRNYVSISFQTDLSSSTSIQNIYMSGKGVFWVLIDKSTNKMIGSIALEDKQKNDGEGELRRMCVSSEYRRQGFGTFLLQHLMSYAFKNGFTRITLSTPTCNAPALGLYFRAGFTLEKISPVSCGADGDLDLSYLEIFNPNPPLQDEAK